MSIYGSVLNSCFYISLKPWDKRKPSNFLFVFQQYPASFSARTRSVPKACKSDPISRSQKNHYRIFLTVVVVSQRPNSFLQLTSTLSFILRKINGKLKLKIGPGQSTIGWNTFWRMFLIHMQLCVYHK